MMYDVFVIGGGINGCGVARDAAGRGYSVYLAEMNDLASGTSSWSTKLIHGGLRYLEHYEFRLVREALMERELLWGNAPHIIWPLRFVLPHHKGLRPAWLLRTGLFLYDHLGGRKDLPPTRTLDLRNDPAGAPLKGDFARAFEYSDCWVNDARLVVLNARDAADRGAVIATRTKVTSISRREDGWSVSVEDQATGNTQEIAARLIVNAAGPWVDEILRGPAGYNDAHNVRLVQGSHIVVPKIFDHDRCYIFQNEDGRIIFAIPYEQDYTLIGTTDRDYEGDPGAVAITDEEKVYLCEAASEYFNAPVRLEDIVWSYSGVRPLFDDGASKAQEATRDYILKADERAGAPMVNIFGGKITTYRRLAESMLEKIGDLIGAKGERWTAAAPLPGGDFPKTDYSETVDALRRDFVFLPERLARRLVRAYGTDAREILGEAGSLADLGEMFGADLSEAEVRWLVEKEWARTADDILWRRSKLGLRFSPEETAALASWLDGRPQAGKVARSG
jgi:glycerol-3-phosphate dehydrogenase